MLATLMDYDAVVTSLIQDRAEKLRAEDRNQAIQQAIDEYSRFRPVIRRRSLAGSGMAYLGTPTGWQDDFSTIQRIEYPVGQMPPTYLSPDTWVLTSSPTALTTFQLYFVDGSIPTSARLNVEWTVPHHVSETAGTIPVGHYRAVATLGASYACLQLAGFYAQSGDSTIQIDSQDPRSKSQEYRALAKEYRSSYFRFFGISEDEAGTEIMAAGVFQELSSGYAWGWPFFHHARRR